MIWPDLDGLQRADAPRLTRPVPLPSLRSGPKGGDSMSSDLAIRARLRCAALAISGMLLGMTIGWSSAIAKTTEILVFGDSIAAGFGLPTGEAFPARLEANLPACTLTVHIFNAANSGALP